MQQPMLAHRPTTSTVWMRCSQHLCLAWTHHACINGVPHSAQDISEAVDERVAYLKQNGCSELVIESVLKNVDPY